MELLKSSVASLQKKSTTAVSTFRKVIKDLTETNKEAMKLAEEKSVKVKTLQDEVHSLATLTQDNEKVIKKIQDIIE